MPTAFKKSVILFIFVAVALAGYFALGAKEKDGLIDREVQFALELVPLLYDQVPWAKSRHHLESVSQRETDKFVERLERIEDKLAPGEKEAIATALANVTPEMSIFELVEVFQKRKDDHFPIGMTKSGRYIYSKFVVNRLIKAVIDKDPVHDAKGALAQGDFSLISVDYTRKTLVVRPVIHKVMTPGVSCSDSLVTRVVRYDLVIYTVSYFLDHENDLHEAFKNYLSEYNRYIFQQPDFPFREFCSPVEGP